MQTKTLRIKDLQKETIETYPNNVSQNPLVSVCVQTYQHEKYIKQCLDGILMQQTNFDFEILLGEDESKDKTREICKEYAKKHNKKIKLFLHNRKNLIKINGNPTGRFNFLYNLEKAKGKYIALCEGDDYWTDKNKLQKQVDFLENNANFSICFHNMEIFYENDPEIKEFSNINQKEITTINDLAKGNYIYTASCVFRNNNLNLPEFITKTPVGDYPLFMLNAKYGKIKYINSVMGVYRKHDGGVWANKNYEFTSINFLKTRELLIDNFDDTVNKILKNQYRKNAMHLGFIYLNINNIEKAKKCFNKANKYVSRFKFLLASVYYLTKIFIKVVKI